MTSAAERRPRDPDGRRQAIVAAAGRVIARSGMGRFTHRRVAAEADVPVGSTTYYFDDIGALREAALAHAATTSAEFLNQWRRDVSDSTDLPATLARLTAEYLTDGDRHRTLNELYLAAGHRADLQQLARLWPDGLIALLEPRVGHRAAQAVAMFVDGSLLHALITGTPPETATLRDGIARLVG